MIRSANSILIKKPGKIGLLSWIIMLTGLLLHVSCEEIMDVSFTGDSSKNLVVEGSITTDTLAHRIALSFTGDYFDHPAKEMATGAEVSIYDGDSTFMLHEVSAGEYYTDTYVHGVAGKTYTLNIKLTNGRQYTASDKLLPCADFDSIGQSPNHQIYDGDYGYDVLFYGKEPEPLGNNYMYLVYLNNVLYSDTLSEISFVNDEFVNGEYIRDYIVYRIRESDVHPTYVGITLEMHSITREYYDYMSAMMLETVWKGSPWDGPPASVNGNITNGARGYFRASEVKRRFRYFAPLPRIN
jgi:hypothetical protein